MLQKINKHTKQSIKIHSCQRYWRTNSQWCTTANVTHSYTTVQYLLFQGRQKDGVKAVKLNPPPTLNFQVLNVIILRKLHNSTINLQTLFDPVHLVFSSCLKCSFTFSKFYYSLEIVMQILQKNSTQKLYTVPPSIHSKSLSQKYNEYSFWCWKNGTKV